MISFLIQGGVVLIPILALSVIAVALIIQKSVYFINIRNRVEDLGAYVIEALQTGKGRAVLSELQRLNCPEARVLLAGLQARRAGQSQELISLHMESIAMRSADDLEKHVPYLASIANLATLLGLLGTVTGMIVSFLNLKVSGVSDPALLAGGISQALITTAAGLTVAIPSLLFFHIFRQKVNRTLARMEIAASELLTFLSRQKRPERRV
ncbi:MAG: MotA/TolQ/ExbB proton channel family protein [Spirochaetales bacterium]|nr:MotA/TolQ/ExbB proton channel family protein [Spirochaetales bacterium]